MTKIWNFIKKHFITQKFLTFGIIGVVNTVIDLIVYRISYTHLGQTNLIENTIMTTAFISGAIAFIVASIFSYFANAIYTFKPKKKSTAQFSIVMLVFLTRLFISSLLTSWFDYACINWLNFNYDIHNYLSLIPRLFASALLIPIAYFALDWVFKKTDSSVEV